MLCFCSTAKWISHTYTCIPSFLDFFPIYCCRCSVTRSCLTLLGPQGLQHSRLLCPLLSPGAYSKSCPLSGWLKWDGWMASPTQWVLVDSRSWWWTERPGMLQSTGLQKVGHNWATELNWTEWVMLSNHFILCCPLLLLPLVFPTIRIFSSESALHIGWPKNWSFSFSINPSNEYSGMISFRIAWFDLLVVQGTLKSLLQHHCLKASILEHSAFFMVQLSYLYMTNGKTSIQTFVGKVISL